MGRGFLEDKQCQDTDQNGDASFDDVDVSPSSPSANIVKLTDAKSEQTGKGAGSAVRMRSCFYLQDASKVEDGRSTMNLSRSIPCGQGIGAARIHSRLEETKHFVSVP